ncbi:MULTISPECIES: methionine biosynthesis protein MetW [unclassified Pseudomonas]|uniref:methionine biosynthesis protein MetW n=1 Tax=unclassified Pseudomonas TaxID=196821 RepID=UPI0009E08753|nr:MULTISPECIES: methionine biosynthesis protein MetW [unclassified Pseudomonas]
MKIFKKIPVLRVLHRYWREITRPAPLQEFEDYDTYWQMRVREQRTAKEMDRYRLIASVLPVNASVLDIGCGEGSFLRYLSRNRPDCKGSGADISISALEELTASGISVTRIDPQRRLVEQLAGSWDVVVLMEVIEHVVDAEDLVRQVIELGPRRIFITIPNAGFLLHRLRLLFGGRFPITTIVYHMREHIRFWTVKDFEQWADVLGMHIHTCRAQVDRPDRLVRWLSNWHPALFAAQVVYELSPNVRG